MGELYEMPYKVWSHAKRYRDGKEVITRTSYKTRESAVKAFSKRAAGGNEYWEIVGIRCFNANDGETIEALGDTIRLHL